MEYLIEHMARHGVYEIMINVAYLHRKIEHYFGDGHRWGVEIGYSYEGFATFRIFQASSMKPPWCVR